METMYDVTVVVTVQADSEGDARECVHRILGRQGHYFPPNAVSEVVDDN